MSFDDELEAFKRLPINFAAAAIGYRIDKRKSSKQSAVMVGPNGHKIICSTSRVDGHGVFFSADGNVSGSIIDLVQHVEGCNLGVVRKILRPLLEQGGLSHQVEFGGDVLQPATTNYLGVLARFSNFEHVTSSHDYLCGKRKIPRDILLHQRFANRIFHDPDRGSAIFPHYGSPDNSRDRCMTGYVIKNDGLTRFSKDGKKGLWPSNVFPGDRQLVVAEAAIDALSYACLEADIAITRFLSTGGQLNSEQPTLLQSAIEKLLPGGEVIAAVDNDDGGDQLAGKLTQCFHATGRTDLSLRTHVPSTRGDDWNRVLCHD